MSLTSAKIKKLLESHFNGTNPIIIKNDEERRKTYKEIVKHLKHVNGVCECDISDNSMRQYMKKEHCRLDICLPSERYSTVYFQIEVNNENKLIMSHYGQEAFIYDLNQVYSFPAEVIAELQKAKFEEQKREKIRIIKRKAIVAKNNEVAKEEKVEYCIVEQSRKLKFMVHLGPGERLEIDIPYNKFHDTLSKIQKAVQTIRELREEGLSIKIRGYAARYNEPSWINPNES